MSVIGHATLNVVPSTKGFSAALQTQAASSGVDAVGDGAGKKMGAGMMAGLVSLVNPVALAATAGLAVGAFVSSAVGAAGALQQSAGGVETVFKSGSDAVAAFAADAAKSIGLSKNEYNELATVIGSQLKNAGTSMDELGPKTDSMIGLGGDLAAMFGGTTADAVGALSSALKGERDPIERYGVSLSQAAIDAEAARLGFEKVGGTLDAEANAAATMSLIMAQTADAHGAAAREADSLQSRQQQLSAGWENLKAKIGQAFLPAAAGAVGMLSQLVAAAGPFIETVGPALAGMFAPFGAALAEFGPLLGQLLPNLTPFGLIFQVLAPVLPQVAAMLAQVASVLGGAPFTVVTALTPVIQTLTGLLSGVLAAVLPILAELFTSLAPVIGMAAQIVAELVAAVAPLVSQLADLLIPVIQALLPIVETVFAAVGNIIQGAMTLVQGVITTVMAVIRGDWSGAWAGIQGILRGAWDMIVSAVRGAIDLVVAVFRDLLPAIGTALSGIGSWLFETGQNLIQGLIDGVRAMSGALWDGIVGIVQDAVGGVLDFLGIHSPSRLFRGIGVNIGEGLVIGMDRMQDNVERSALNLASAAADAVSAVDLGIGEGGLIHAQYSVADAARQASATAANGKGGDTFHIHESTSAEATAQEVARRQKARAA